MSKTLATIEIHADIDYDLSGAKLNGISSLYTEEAYLLCKRLEFKNLLNRFAVETPKNQAAEHFKLVEDRKEAEKVFAKLRGRNCGFILFPEAKRKTATRKRTGR